MTSASQRPTEDILWAMETWLTCPILTPTERSVINWMHGELKAGQSWETVRGFAVATQWPVVLNAITKARAVGLLRHWRTNNAEVD